MKKQDHINFWESSGMDFWNSALILLENEKHRESLFLFCLAVEKWLKANWVMDNIENVPPRIHDLQSLYSQTELDCEDDLVDFLDTVNRWNLEGRYPDYKKSLAKLATKEYMEKQYEKLQKLKECLLKKL